MLIDLLFILAGFVLLYFGAEGLLRGSVSLAFRFGLSSMVIGLTVVAYGTSMPEMIVSVQAALQGKGDISIGNVVGSNIFNIAAIVGLAALISPIKVKPQMVKYDTPIMLGVTLLFLLLFWDNQIARWEGAIFFIGIIAYSSINLIVAKKIGLTAEEMEEAESIKRLRSLWLEAAFIVAGLGLLVAGAWFLVEGAVGIAKHFGISDAVIGLTIIAAGTSLPELATSVVAAIHKHSDIALANVVGSNVFNILSILGVTALICPINGGGITSVDMYMMLGVSVLLLPFMRTGFRISRIEGAVLLGSYIAYVIWLVHTQVK